MHLDINKDKQRLLNGTFRRKEKAETLDKLYELLPDPKYSAFRQKLFQIKEMTISSYLLWDFDINGMGHYICDQLKKGKSLDDEFEMLLEFSDDLPDEETQRIFCEYEQYVASGYYPVVRETAKYLNHLKRLRKNPKFLADLKRL